MFDLIEKHGLKWTMISKGMNQTRTEHMVKNRYLRYYKNCKMNRKSAPTCVIVAFNQIYKKYLKKKQLQLISEQE